MSISLKVLDNTKQIAEYTVVHGQPLQINAQENVNYQLVDNQLGYAPDNILAKREGKNLVIFLDDGDMNADVIIENYYDDEGETTNLVVGLHENGNIYAYVPESGAVPEAISMLAEEVTAPQALGGKALESAMWAFNPYWLAGLLPFAVAGAIYHYQDKHYGVKTSATPASAPLMVNLNPIKAGDTAITGTVNDPNATVEITLPNGQKITATIDKTNPNPDGTYNFTAQVPTGTPLQANDKVGVNATSPTDTMTDEGTVTPKLSVELNPIKAGDTAITGKVNDPNATVEITLPNGQKITATVDKNNPNPDGTYNFTAQVPTGTPLQANDKVGVNAMSPTETATDEGTVTPNSTPELSVELNPIKAGDTAITGKVNDPNAMVEITLPNGQKITATVDKTNPNPDGTYNFTAQVPTGTPLQANEKVGVNAMSPTETATGEGTVTPNSTPELSVELNPIKAGDTAITGTVNDPNATVEITLPNGDKIIATVDKNNPNPDGTYNFTAQVPTGTPLQANDKVGVNAMSPTETATGEGTVTPNSTPELSVELNPIKAGDTAITGKVNDPNATVEITLPNGQKITATVDKTNPNSDGTYNFTAPVPTGTPLQANEKVGVNAMSPTETATGEGTVTPKLSVELDPIKAGDTAITGKVNDPNAMVEITLPNGQKITATVDKTNQNPDGTYNFTAPVPTGTPLQANDKVGVNAMSPTETATDEGTVTPNSTPELSVELNPIKAGDTAITGKVNDPNATVEITLPNRQKITATVDKTNPNPDGTYNFTAQVPTGTPLQANDKVGVNATSPTETATGEGTVTPNSTPELSVELNPIKAGDTAITGTVNDPNATVEITLPNSQKITATVDKTNPNPDDTYNFTAPVPTGTPLQANEKVGVNAMSPTETATGEGTVAPTSGENNTPNNKTDLNVTIDPIKEGADKIRGTVDDPNATVELNLPNNTTIQADVSKTPNPDGKSPFVATVPEGVTLKEGDVVTANATNPENNSVSSALTPVQDGTAPTLILDEVKEGAQQITGRVDDPTATVKITLPNGEIIEGKINPVRNEDGTYNFTAEIPPSAPPLKVGEKVSGLAQDPVGNGSNATETVIADVPEEIPVQTDPDTTAPIITLTPPRAGADKIRGTVDDPTATVTITLPSGEQIPAKVSQTPNLNGRYPFVADVPANVILKENNQITANAHDPQNNSAIPVNAPVLDGRAPNITLDEVKEGAQQITGRVDDPTATVKITLPNGEIIEGKINLVRNEDGTYNFTAEIPPSAPPLKEGEKVSGLAQDPVGNGSSVSKIVGAGAPIPEIVVTIDPIAENDVINHTEAKGKVVVSGKVVGDIGETTTVNVQVNGISYPAQVNKVSDSEATYTVEIEGSDFATAESQNVVVTAISTSDLGVQGNATKGREYEVATRLPSPTLTLDKIAEDGVLNQQEASQNVPVSGQIQGEKGKDWNEQTVVNVKIGEDVYPATVQPDGRFSASVPGEKLKEAQPSVVTVTATTIDENGNQGTSQPVNEPYRVNTNAPNITVEIESVADDDIISADEAKEGAKVVLKGSISGELGKESALTLVINVGGMSIPVPTDKLEKQTDGTITFSVELDGKTVAESPNRIIRATVSTEDEDGNQGSDIFDHPYRTDTNALNVTIELDNIAEDNVINSEEAQRENTLISGRVGGDYLETDTVTLTLQGGQGDPIIKTVPVDAQGRFSLNVPTAELSSHNQVSAKIETSRPSGNKADEEAVQTYEFKTDLTTPVIVIESVDDGTINLADVQRTAVPVRGTVTNAKAGDPITLIVNGEPYSGSVGEDGRSFSIDVNGADLAQADKVSATVTTRDNFGNSATSEPFEKSYKVDLTPPVLNINPLQVGDNSVSGKVTNEAGEPEANVEVELTLGGERDPIRVTTNANGEFTAPITPPLSKDMEVTGRAIDEAGNESAPEREIVTDTRPLDVKITLNNIAGNNVINAGEAGNKIVVSGKVTGEFSEGDIVTLTIGNGAERQVPVNASGDFRLELDGSELANATDKFITAATIIANKDGRTGQDSTSRPYRVDTDLPSLNIELDNVTPDGKLSSQEAGGQVTISGTVTGEFANGDRVTLVVDGTRYTGRVNRAGKFSIPVPGNKLLADADHTIQASVSHTDSAGNTGTASTSKTYGILADTPEINTHTDFTTPDKAGTVTVTSGLNNNKLVVAYRDESGIVHGVPSTTEGAEKTLTLLKDTSGRWALENGENLPSNVALITTADGRAQLTFQPNALLDGQSITATGSSAGAEENAVNQGVAPTDLRDADDFGWHVYGRETPSHNYRMNRQQQTWQATNNGDLMINGGASNEHLILEYTNNQDQLVTLELKRGTDGLWKDQNGNNVTTTSEGLRRVAQDTAGTQNLFILDGRLVKDGTMVKAWEGSQNGPDLFLSGNNQQNRNDLVWNAESKTFEVKADAQPQKNNSWGYAPTTTLQANITINDITPDNLINATERDQTIPLSGRISGAFRKDDVVELTINGEKYRTTIKDEQGNFDLPVKGSDLAQDSEIEVKVIVTDAHGNSQEINGTHSHRIDLSADKPTITTFPNNGSATVTAGGDNVELTVSWTNTQGQTQNVTLTKGPNGWTGNLPTGVTITDPTQGTVTIDQSLIQDGTPVNATGKDAQGQTANADSRPAGNDAVEAPSINYHANLQNVAGAVERGQVTVTPGNDNDKMVITFTDESNIKHGVASTTTGTQQTLTVVKNAQGRWEVQGNNPDSANIEVNPATGAVTLKPNAVLDGSAVNVVGYNKEATANGVAGNNGATAGTDFAEYQRAITARSDVGWWVIGEEHNGWQPGADGNLLIVPAGNAQNNEHLIIEFTNEQNQAQTVEVTKRADGKWYLGNQEITANSATLKLSNGGFELDGKLVKDGTAVKAWDKSGDPGQDTFISGNNQRGSLADLNPQTLEVLPNAQPNKQNSWAIAPAGYTAQAPSINYHANLQNVAGAVERGQVTVTPGNDNDKMVITFTDESNIKHGVTSTTTGTQQTLTVVKNAQGRWEVQGNNPDSANIEVNPATGAVTLKPNAVLDGTAVNVVGYNKEATANGVAGNNGATAGVDLAEHQRALAERNDAGWWVIGEEHNGWQPGADGNLLIVPAGGAQNNEHLIIEFTNEQNQAQTVEVTKRADGKWYLGNQEITANSATLKLSNGGFELDGKLVKDGTAVKAWDKSGDPGQDTFISGNNQRGSLADLNPQTLEVLPNAQPNKQNSWAIAPLKISSADQPLVGTNPDGSINVTAGTDNTRLKVVYFDETGSKYGAEGATGSTVTFTDATPIEHNGTPAQARVDYTMPTNREVTLNFVKGNNGIWTLEGGNNNLPSGVTINNGVISFSADSVMGNTLMTVTATNSAGVTNTNTGRASVDSHTATRQVWLETVAEMTEASRTPILRDNWATNTRGVNRESLTFNAEDQGGSTKSVPSYVFEYTDRAGVKHTDVFKLDVYNGNDTAWYRTDTFTGEVSDAQIRASLNKTGTVVNEINGYWTQGDSIAVSADLKNSMQINSTAYLWSLDSSKGGKWQLQDSWIVPEQVVKKHEVAQFDDPKIDQMVAASNRVNRDIYIENDNDHSGGLTALLEWNNSARSNGQDSEGGRLFNGSHFNFNEALSIFAGFHLQEPRRTEMRTAKLNYTQGNDYLMTTQSIGALNPGSDQQNRIKNMRFNFDDGADMVVAGRDIGTSTATRSGTMTMNMGNGNDIVIAGAGNEEVQLALNNSNGSIDYFFTFNGGVPTATHTPLNKLNDFDGREGGRISGNVVINMDNGDDTLIVEGTRAGGPAGLGEGAAIGEGARINMGAGDDVVMVASYSSLRGNIDNSTVDLGTGNDTISIGGELTGSTRVHGGAGIDTFTYLASSTNNTLDYTKTSGFEIVHLQGGNLNLTWGSVGSAGLEAPLHVSGTGQVTLDGNERAVRQVNEEGIIYNVYTDGSSRIYIESGVTVI